MPEVRQLTLGSTFRATFVSSGATASPISYSVLTGSESLVSSYAGVSSGNGHYYADAVVSTPGLYKGQWLATISANSYKSVEWLAAFPYDTDQPGRYITWDDVVNRFTGFSDIGGAVKAASHYLSYAEAEIDSRLGVEFTTPFSNSNITVRDIVIDMVYLRSIRWSQEGYKELKEEIDGRIKALVDGDAVMIDSSGAVVDLGGSTTPAWSNTQDYHPIFAATLDYTDMVPSSLQMQAEADERGI